MNTGRIGNPSENISDFIRKTSSDGSFEKHLEEAAKQEAAGNSVSTGGNGTQKLKEVCREFEGVMLEMMYKGMKAGVPKSELISGGSGGEIFEEMLDKNMVEEASKNRSLGLADMLYRQLSNQIK